MPAQVQPQCIRVVLLQQLPHPHQVAQRLAHLLILVLHHGNMHPEANKGFFTGDRLNLGNLALMMRETQIAAAQVNIYRFAQKLGRHGRTLNVPTGSPGSPGTVPGGFTRRLRLPEHKIEWIERLLGSSGWLPRSLAIGSISARGNPESSPNAAHHPHRI